MSSTCLVAKRKVMKVLTKVSSKGRRGGEVGGGCVVTQHTNSRGTQMHFLMTQFLQRKELRLQHFTIQRQRLTSILPIVCGVFGKEAMLFCKMVFHGCKCWSSRRGGGIQWKKAVTRFGFDRPKRSGHEITVIKMNVLPLSPSHCPPCNLTLATVGNYALRGSPSSQQKLIM